MGNFILYLQYKRDLLILTILTVTFYENLWYNTFVKYGWKRSLTRNNDLHTFIGLQKNIYYIEINAMKKENRDGKQVETFLSLSLYQST